MALYRWSPSVQNAKRPGVDSRALEPPVWRQKRMLYGTCVIPGDAGQGGTAPGAEWLLVLQAGNTP